MNDLSSYCGLVDAFASSDRDLPVTKMTLFEHGVISKKNVLYMYHVHIKRNFKPKISSLFHFEYVNQE